jgi:hypothetical protein
VSEKHTDGPWCYERRCISEEHGVYEYDVHEFYEDDPPLAVVTTWGTEADAALIAAAPAMLERADRFERLYRKALAAIKRLVTEQRLLRSTAAREHGCEAMVNEAVDSAKRLLEERDLAQAEIARQRTDLDAYRYLFELLNESEEGA